MKSKVFKAISFLTLLIYIVINLIGINSAVYAQSNEGYDTGKISNYPGYLNLLEDLKARHPNWNFTLFYTGLDWNQVIKNETTAYHGRNVVPSSKGSSWICSSCGNTPKGGSSWRCASEVAVAYYMDPRNWLNDAYIFQFERLSYNGAIQTIDGVRQIISNVGYMQGDAIYYTRTDGSQGVINKSYAQVIVEAAAAANISPYHLASRLKQEQGGGSVASATARGTYGGYVGYYNFMNIGATGNSDGEVISNGLSYAMSHGWTDPEISIRAGAEALASSYIGLGQDTLYLQKFDVDDQDGNLYWHQYMQNAAAAVNEGASVRSAYQSLGFMDNSIDFRIPVYENMPDTICNEPGVEGIVTQNVKIKGTNVNIRSGPGTGHSIIATENTGYNLLRIETANSTNEGFYWDKVVLPDGRKGYVARNYIVQVADITNCNDVVTTNTSVNLRNGPGTEGTTVITTLIQGQVLTRIATGEYNLDGYIWDRVKLSDGRQGYIAQNYIDIGGSIAPSGSSSSSSNEIIKVICNSGLKVRQQPGTGSSVLTYVDKNDTLTRIEAGASNVDGYIWDKIVTSDGIEGYIARGDEYENYIEVIQSASNNIPAPEPTPESQPQQDTNKSNDNVKIENENVITEPATTVESLKEKYSDAKITNKDGQEISSGNIGTGYKITVDGNTYTAIKLGDGNGDGEIDTGDSFLLKQVIMGIKQLDTDEFKSAIDLNRDGEINTGDSFALKKHIMNIAKITI